MISCGKDDPSPSQDMTPPPNSNPNPTPNPSPGTGDIVVSGTFTSGPGELASGTVKIDDKNVMTFENFSTNNGPDLKVYISKDLQASSYIRVGDLKSASGAQTYQVPGNPDYGQYKYVLIWCEQFTVLFGSAKLE